MSSSQYTRLLMGNWKMNGSLASNQTLLAGLLEGLEQQPTNHQLVVFAPYVFLAQLQSLLTGSAIQWGAQDLSAHEQGAYTGEVSAAMVSEFGCQWVLVGHSERRQHFAESDALIAAKVAQALHHGLRPVLCVGETQAEYEAQQTEQVLARQLAPVLALGAGQLQGLVIAYEPVWAIGSGRSASPEYAGQVHAFIDAQLQQAGCAGVPVVYGGSVNGDNAGALFAQPRVDGALVGGASLSADEFLRIVAA